MLGMKVKVQFTVEMIARGVNPSATYRNVTEIHYQYREGMVAFESDIHVTGITWQLAAIREFEVTVEKEEAEAF